ncbi:MAG: hypothetical protein QW134_00790 [Nitrososphaeria archaeon]
MFDPSSIFRAIKENRIELLTEGSTVELARYELSNTIWKEQHLHKKLSMKEAKDHINEASHSIQLIIINIKYHKLSLHIKYHSSKLTQNIIGNSFA